MANASRFNLNMFSNFHQMSSQENCRLLVLAPGNDRNIPIRRNRHIKHDRATTDLAILDVLLLWQGVVDQDGDGLAAIGASNRLFVELRHRHVYRKSVALFHQHSPQAASQAMYLPIA